MALKGSKPKHFPRITFLALVIFIFTLFLILRLFNLQVVDSGDYAVLATNQHKISKYLKPSRGSIFIIRQDYPLTDNLYPLATNEKRYEVYVDTRGLKGSMDLSEQVARILNLDAPALYEKFSKEDDPYEPLMHFITEEQMLSLSDLKNPALNFFPEDARLYPEGPIYSQVTGFMGYSGNERIGQYGLEGAFEELLAGVPGRLDLEADNLGNWIPFSKKNLVRANNGADLILTLDNAIQFFACQILEEGLKKYGAESGSITVMAPQTGAILALCVSPNFDPNNYSQVKDINVYRNQVTTGNYEPGSIFKAITLAAAFDAGKLTSETTYEDFGAVKIGVETIKNSDLKAHGVCNMITVLEKSLNTGAIFAMRQIGPAVFRDYVKKFGFGAPTGLELTPETPGNISSLEKGEIYAATASFGQGISVTPIQMLTSFSVLANNGKLVKPYLVSKIINHDGEIQETQPQVVRQVITPETAARISAILVSVVKNGYSAKASVNGYYLAGKTGTAQVPEKGKRGYSADLTVHSFIGFGPVDNPRFIALIKLDYPKNVRFAADSAAPMFSRLARFILNHYEVPPDK